MAGPLRTGQPQGRTDSGADRRLVCPAGWSRFIDITALDDREPNVPNCAGYTGNGTREPGGRVVWLVSPSVLRDEIARGHDPANAATRV